MRGPKPNVTGFARHLRIEQTNAEARLWKHLRARQIDGHKFVRQVPVGPYFCDFICRERKLVIEVDGGQHADSARDVIRDQYLDINGYRILRFWNNDVLGNIDGVVLTIAAALRG
ncbi:endonuclease domain-containing protein [Nitrobacter sp. JJSN]|jgi:very-short-patch-repair endonuclease|uniref:endonuclease domain-containing protein n=1 Tax=Nitrobacter sp. JJSN TaxID=3453033 RepID=UPI003F7672D3